MNTLFYIVAFWAIGISLTKIKNNLLKLIIALLPFFLMIAFRDVWLPDDLSYRDSWNWHNHVSLSQYISAGGHNGKLEPGYWLIAQLPFEATTFVIALISISAQIFVMYRLCPDKYYFLVFALYFFNAEFAAGISARRSCVAIAIFITAITLKVEGKRLWPIGLILIAGLFHRSAFILLPFLLLPLDVIDRYYKIMIAIFLIVLVVVVQNAVLINTLMIGSLEESSFESYLYYYGDSIEGGFGIGKFIWLAIALLAIYTYTKTPKNKQYSFVFFIAMVYLMLHLLPEIGLGRIYAHFSFLTFIFIAMSLQKNNKFYVKALALVFSVYVIRGFMVFLKLAADYEGVFQEYSSVLF